MCVCVCVCVCVCIGLYVCVSVNFLVNFVNFFVYRSIFNALHFLIIKVQFVRNFASVVLQKLSVYFCLRKCCYKSINLCLNVNIPFSLLFYVYMYSI